MANSHLIDFSSFAHEMGFVCSAKNLPLESGVVFTTHLPYDFTISSVRGSLSVAPSGSPVELKIKVDDTNIFIANPRFEIGQTSISTSAFLEFKSFYELQKNSRLTIEVFSNDFNSDASELKIILVGNRDTQV